MICDTIYDRLADHHQLLSVCTETIEAAAFDQALKCPAV
jgi:hypothetical protein